MVLMVVSKLGRIDMILIDAGVKINKRINNREVLLTVSCVRSVESSLSSSKALHLLTQCAIQSTCCVFMCVCVE